MPKVRESFKSYVGKLATEGAALPIGKREKWHNKITRAAHAWVLRDQWGNDEAQVRAEWFRDGDGGSGDLERIEVELAGVLHDEMLDYCKGWDNPLIGLCLSHCQVCVNWRQVAHRLLFPTRTAELVVLSAWRQ